MSVLFQILLNSQKISYINKSLKYSSSYSKCLFARSYSDSPKTFITFDEVVAQRRAEARRSLVVQVNSKSSFCELYSYCSNYAEIKGVHHYKNPGGEHFMLIEFTSEDNAKSVLKSCGSYQKNDEALALPSPFLWFRAIADKKKQKLVNASELSLLTEDGTSKIDDNKLIHDMMACQTVSDQIQMLYDQTALNDLGIRLKYIVARQLEMVLESSYANVELRPFGSSVNGFGKIGCDLDLVLTNNITDEMVCKHKRLVYQQKRAEGRWQRELEDVAAALEARVAGAGRVARILHARVPILKYQHQLAGVQVDLCYSNMSGVYMSELLHLLGSLDPRVRPLVLSARRWAAARGLTSHQPGRWVTNFSITLLVLFFLQQEGRGRQALLPPVSLLLQLARKEDIRIAEDNLNCTFLRDLNLLPPKCFTQNDAKLETLLLQFFEFYSQFDFHNKAICIIEGVAVKKPNHQPLYIVNPLETSLNVSRNVSFEECERIQSEMRNAAWQLETIDEGEKKNSWGLLGLTEKASILNVKNLVNTGNSHRLIELEALFENEETKPEAQPREIRNKLESITAKITKNFKKDSKNKVTETQSAIYNEADKSVEKIKFKNPQVQSEVYRIRRNKMS